MNTMVMRLQFFSMCFSVVTWMCFFPMDRNGQVKSRATHQQAGGEMGRWNQYLLHKWRMIQTLLFKIANAKTWLYLVGMANSWFANLRLPQVVAATVNVITHNHLARIYFHFHDCWSVWALSLLRTTNHQVMMFRNPPKQIDEKRMCVCLKKCLNWASHKFVTYSYCRSSSTVNDDCFWIISLSIFWHVSLHCLGPKSSKDLSLGPTNCNYKYNGWDFLVGQGVPY